jgi:hypothetical protein
MCISGPHICQNIAARSNTLQIKTLIRTRDEMRTAATLNELLISLQKRYPNDTEEELKARFLKCALADDAFRDQLADFWFSHKTAN